MAVCESVIQPIEFDYTKRKGNGRPPASHPKIFKAFPLKAIQSVKNTKELVRMLRAEPLSRRLYGWDSTGLVPSRSRFSRVFGEFAERGFTDAWFAEIVKDHGAAPRRDCQLRLRARGSQDARGKREAPSRRADRPRPAAAPPVSIQGTRDAASNIAELPV